MCARQPHSICFTDFLRGGRSLLWVSFDVYTFLLHALMSVHNTMTDNNVCETTQFQYARSAPLEITRNDILREAQDTFTCVTRLISMRDSPHFIFCKRNRMPVYFSSIFCLVFDVVLYVHVHCLCLMLYYMCTTNHLSWYVWYDSISWCVTLLNLFVWGDSTIFWRELVFFMWCTHFCVMCVHKFRVGVVWFVWATRLSHPYVWHD